MRLIILTKKNLDNALALTFKSNPQNVNQRKVKL